MSTDIVFETKDDRAYAPSVSSRNLVNADEEFAKELEKIPDKLEFKIGEVASLADVKPYVLRYWETEFDALKPQKSKHNQRVYSRKDVELVLMLKKLLHKDRFSIEGARSALKRMRSETKKAKALVGAATEIDNLRDELQDLVLDIANIKRLFR